MPLSVSPQGFLIHFIVIHHKIHMNFIQIIYCKKKFFFFFCYFRKLSKIKWKQDWCSSLCSDDFMNFRGSPCIVLTCSRMMGWCWIRGRKEQGPRRHGFLPCCPSLQPAHCDLCSDFARVGPATGVDLSPLASGSVAA